MKKVFLLLIAFIGIAMNLNAEEIKVVLLGNSITELWPLRDAQFFKSHPGLICKGVSGQTSGEILRRFDSDVLCLHPDAVVILAGTNDIALNGGPYDEDVTLGNIMRMAELARENGILPVLASCPPAEGFKWRPEVTDAMEKIRSLNSRIREYAESEGLPFADYYGVLVNNRETAMDRRYTDEPIGVHPNEAGYAVMRPVLLRVLEKISEN